MYQWVKGNGEGAPEGALLEVRIRHCNPDLNEPDKTVRGRFGTDGFYLGDSQLSPDGELSINWDIIQWRLVR
jgi:hypothetical protein